MTILLIPIVACARRPATAGDTPVAGPGTTGAAIDGRDPLPTAAGDADAGAPAAAAAGDVAATAPDGGTEASTEEASAAQWPEDYPRPGALAWAKAERTPRENLLVEFELQPGDGSLEATWSAWLDALRASGRALVAEYGGMRAGLHSASFSGSGDSGRPCWIVLGRWGEEPIGGALGDGPPPSEHPPLDVPGECVEVPEPQFTILVHPNASFRDDPERAVELQDIPWIYRTARQVDLDGDGALDSLVPVTERAYCPEDVAHDVYLSRGTCGVKVGRISGRFDWAALRRLPPGAHGLPDLVTTREEREPYPRGYGALAVTELTRTWRFDGRGYGEPEVVTHDRGRMTCSPDPCSIPTCTGAIELLPDGASLEMLALPEYLGGEALERGREAARPAVRDCAAGRDRIAATLTIDCRTGRVTKVEFYDSENVPGPRKACMRRALGDVVFERCARPEMQVSLTWVLNEPDAEAGDGGTDG